VRISARWPLLWAALATGAALGWQALTVRFNYGGDWSALFDTGGYTAAPGRIAGEGVYRFEGSAGFDGQYYHFLAHDPLLRGDTARFIDNVRLRWRRILLPALAFAAAGGDPERVDSAYSAVVLAFVFLGTWWAARWCAGCGRHPGWCLVFLLVPAVLVSLDRYTVDVALAALCVGFARLGRALDDGEPSGTGSAWGVVAVAAVAPFARETGVVLAGALAIHWLLQRNWRRAALACAALAPYGAWLWYVAARAGRDQTVFASYVPFRGLMVRTLDPLQGPLGTRWLFTAAVLDYVGVLGIWLAAALVAVLLWKGKRDLVTIAAALFTVVFVAFLEQPQVWAGVYTFGRTMSPLLIFLALAGAARRWWMLLLPLAMNVPRLALQLEPQWAGIRHGIAGLVGMAR
jgi:hypothetical protein